jgi:Dolichyl-phosphate-mannose-protein mannosyltransferase
MTDNVVDDRRERADIRPDFDRGVAIACFGAACAIGLAFAFVGLQTHSFTYDELFTARLLEPVAGTTLLSRIATDVHPPLYLLALALFTQLFGDGDAALRSFSAIAACGAVLVFIAATRSAFSLPARLFGAAMATGSLFWFYQAQNARSYALALLISAGVMALGLSLLPGRSHRRLLVPGLLALMIVGSFVHFYVMYVCLAVLVVLALFARRDRIVLSGAAVFLLLATGFYVKLVMEPYSQVSLTSNWYQNSPAWYVGVLESCVQYSLGDQGLVALLLCGVGILYTRFAPGGRPVSTVATPSPMRWFQSDPATAFLVGVPLLVLAGGIVSSTLLAPNFWDRNFLVVSPFMWGLAARSYDAAVEKATPLIRLVLTCSLAFIVLSMSSIVTSRLPSGEARAIYEPFRQSATWIQSLPACRGQTLPVVTTDEPTWYKPGYAEFIYESGYGRYLQGFAQPQLVFSRDLDRERLPLALMAELQRRVDGGGCPILAWAAHNMSPATIGRIKDKLLGSLDRGDAAMRVATRSFDDGSVGYVLYIQR